MITKEKVEIYRRFGGDIDGWARIGTKEEKSIMSDHDWYLIENFIQDISLVRKKLASKDFARSMDERLKENCDSEATINALKETV